RDAWRSRNRGVPSMTRTEELLRETMRETAAVERRPDWSMVTQRAREIRRRRRAGRAVAAGAAIVAVVLGFVVVRSPGGSRAPIIANPSAEKSPHPTVATAAPSGMNDLSPGSGFAVRTADRGRALVIMFTGAAPYVGDVCTANYGGRVHESPHEVRFRVVVSSPESPPLPEGSACQAAGYLRRVRVGLHRPLGDRHLFDQFGRRI